MSSIEKLSIQGIRSFGTEDRCKQKIKFTPPLTLILGPNGSGKTTIIECLRYVITGDMPPNSGRGGSFVHDPKIAHETSVKAKIILRMKDMTKKIYDVSRSLEVTQTAKDLKFRTLENAISCKDSSGEKVQLSSKCADIDREVCSLLGVSKAILNNVIFCHQEESNWPLSEGKALKQKFDDIFAATRYIKALDSIKKERLSLQSNIKEYGIELKYLAERKQEAEKKKVDLANLEVQLLSSKNRIKQIDKELQPIMKSLEAIFGTEDKVNQLKKQIAEQEAVKGEVEKQQIELNQVIRTLFCGSREELVKQISDFESELKKKKSLLDKLKKESCSAERDCNSLKTKGSKLTEQLGAMNSEQQNHLQRISKRDAFLIKFCNELNVAIPTSEECLSESSVSSAILQIRNRIKDEEDQLKNTKSKYDTLEQELQNFLDTAKEERAKLSHSCSIKSEQMSKNKKKICSLSEELSRADALSNKRAELEENIKAIENELEEEESSKEYDNLCKKLDDSKRKKDNIEALLNQLNTELSKLQKEHKIRAEVDLLMKDKNRKEAEINKIKTRYHDVILHLLGKVPEENVHHNLQKYISNISQDVQSNSNDIERKKLKMSSLETTRQHLADNLKKKEQDLDADKRKVFRVCGNDDYDKTFATLEKKIKELQDEKGALIGSQYIFTTYMDKLRNVSPCCPLCHRGFTENKEAQDLISELENKMKMVPSQLRNKQKNIEEYQEKLNDMTELRPIREGIRKLENDIPKLKEELKSCSEEIEEHQRAIEELKEVLESNKSDQATACSIQEHAVVWDQSYAEMKRLEDRLSNVTCLLGNADMSRNIQTVCDEQDTANMQLDSVKAETEKYQRKLEEHKEHIQYLKSRKNDLKGEMLQITSNLQQQSSREQQMKTLSSENIDLENSIKEAKVELSELEGKLKNLQTEKEKLHKEKETELDILQKKISNIEKQLQDITYLSKEIKKYISDKREEKLKLHMEKLNEINKEIANGEQQISQLNDQMNELNKDLSTHQVTERELKDNLKLLDCKSQLEEIRKTISSLQEQLKSFGIASLLSKKQEILKKRDELSSARHHTLVEQRVREKEIQSLKEEIEKGIYKDADLKHHNKLIEIRTTEIATEDLNKYYIALDHAIMRYHNMKMEEINKIIRELWIKTYVGNDIDYIEIRSDAQEGNFGLDKRRTYNYKVVMLKGDIAIDMRGRCSAGQKVLACLIIRLALAETFCLNCGILALDEPTTNLDRDNIESLAQALAEIVQSRSHQSNFQLIVITHDEEFVDLLGRSDAVDFYYSVSRDNEGLSKIKKSAMRPMA